MATKKNVQNDVQDTDILDAVENGQENGTETAATEQKITFDGVEYTKAELEQKLKDLDAQKKALKAAAKGEKPPAEAKPNKGVLVAFKNKAGEQIIGLGVKYYVARHGGKLHYKEASQVVFLPKDWKEGDPIPAIGESTEPTA